MIAFAYESERIGTRLFYYLSLSCTYLLFFFKYLHLLEQLETLQNKIKKFLLTLQFNFVKFWCIEDIWCYEKWLQREYEDIISINKKESKNLQKL